MQVGHGGGAADGVFGGTIAVDAGENLGLATFNGANAAYAQIGHGDDFEASLSILSGSGTRSGDVGVGAGGDIALTDGMIGHVNSREQRHGRRRGDSEWA